MTWPGLDAWFTVVLLGAATYALRASFLSQAHRMVDLPLGVRDALAMVPPATLAALTLPAIVRPEGAWALTGPRAWAGVIAAVVAWRTRSALATVVVGLVAVALLQSLA